VGRIAADHAADLVVVDLNDLSLQPSPTAPQQIVYAMQPQAILRVIVGGEPIVEDGRLLRVDEREISQRVKQVTAEWAPAETASTRTT
jgi:5-methylthioadenosine/S-adenosylhomocysteine deaminase